MELTTSEQENSVFPAVRAACKHAASRWQLDPTEGWGHVHVAIISRLQRIDRLHKPVKHYVRYTAAREAYRFFRGKAMWRHRQKED